VPLSGHKIVFVDNKIFVFVSFKVFDNYNK
jgi:hypothetical protein